MAVDNETRTHHHPVVAATANYCTIVPEIELAIDGQTDKQRNKKHLTSLELYLSYTLPLCALNTVDHQWHANRCILEKISCAVLIFNYRRN